MATVTKSGQAQPQTDDHDLAFGLAYDALILGISRSIELSFKAAHPPAYDRFPTHDIDHRFRLFWHGKTINAPASPNEERAANASDFLVAGLMVTSMSLGIRRHPTAKAALTLTHTLSQTHLLTTILKRGIRRPRPKEVYFPVPKPHPSVYTSFPSGHSSQAFAAATAALLMAPDLDFWPKAGLWAGAGLVASLRISADKHFLSDVVVGGLFGFWVANMTYDAMHQEPSRHSVKIGIIPGRVSLTYEF